MSDFWQLEDFLARFDQWCEIDDPPTEIRAAVLVWMQQLMTNPFASAKMVPEFGLNTWFAVLPGTEDGNRQVVSFFVVDPTIRTVRCSAITFLRRPF